MIGMSPHTVLTLVSSNRVIDAEFDSICSAAGFDIRRAGQFEGLYAGPSRANRSVAAAIAERLWMRVNIEPLLGEAAVAPITHSTFAVDACEAAETSTDAVLEIARVHRCGHAIIVAEDDSLERVLGDLQASTPEVVVIPSTHCGVREVHLRDERANSPSFPRREQTAGATRSMSMTSSS